MGLGCKDAKWPPGIFEPQTAAQAGIRYAGSAGRGERQEAYQEVCSLFLATHIPHPTRRIRLRCLDARENRRAQRYSGFCALRPSLGRRSTLRDVTDERVRGWAQNWAQ